MNAADIARHLKGHRNGSHGWLVRCPCHEDNSPSLSIKDGRSVRLLVRCFAGCEPADILREFNRLGYLEGADAAPYVSPTFAAKPVDTERRQRFALSYWRNSIPAKGTPVEAYLRSRGYAIENIPLTIRFHESVKYPGSDIRLPAMIAAVATEPCRDIVAIHRTFLSPGGVDKANVPQQKAMLGHCKGGATRLAPAAETLIVAEGIETTLSAMQLYGLPGYAALTASGIEGLLLPDVVKHVIVCADSDKSTAKHARGHGVESAHKARVRWEGEGRTVEIRLPEDGLKDFNDQLRMRVNGATIYTML